MLSSQIIREGHQWLWMVDGKPFCAYAGEVHNSSASSLAYMDRSVWPYVDDLAINTIIFPVYWEKVEQEEGKFDFTLLEGTVQRCREHQMKAIVLWFGLWKNSTSGYVPGWVKTDTKRFFRAEDCHGKKTGTISPLCAEAVAADKRAFSRLMEKVKEINESETTIIAVQVENEMGLLTSDRDYSSAASEKFFGVIPQELAGCCRKPEGSTYDEAFGGDAPSVFMAYSYACAVRDITAAGKAVYSLPMFVNAWLEQYPWRPGSYPSGGPIARLMEVWKGMAPELDALAPDIYLPEFAPIASAYARDDNPLMIPEYRRDIYSLPNAFEAFGKYNALCFSVFGIEDLLTPPDQLRGMFSPAVMASLSIELEAWNIDGSAAMLRQINELLKSTEMLRMEARRNGKVYSFGRNNEMENGTVIETENYSFQILYDRVNKKKPKSAGMIIETGSHEFYIMGTSFKTSCLPKQGANYEIGVLKYGEGSFADGIWHAERTLNGDEGSFIQFYDFPEVRKLELYKF